MRIAIVEDDTVMIRLIHAALLNGFEERNIGVTITPFESDKPGLFMRQA